MAGFWLELPPMVNRATGQGRYRRLQAVSFRFCAGGICGYCTVYLQGFYIQRESGGVLIN